MNDSRFHCCAACIHFRSVRSVDRVRTYCDRLGYETKPTYQFDCWVPNDRVLAKLAQQKPSDGTDTQTAPVQRLAALDDAVDTESQSGKPASSWAKASSNTE